MSECRGLAEQIAAALVTGAENMDGVGGLAERARIFRHLSAIIRSALRGAGIEADAPAAPTLTVPTLHEADEFADLALRGHELGECLRLLYAYADRGGELLELSEPELDARCRLALSLPARAELHCNCDAGVERTDPAIHALSCPMRDRAMGESQTTV